MNIEFIETNVHFQKICGDDVVLNFLYSINFFYLDQFNLVGSILGESIVQ